MLTGEGLQQFSVALVLDEDDGAIQQQRHQFHLVHGAQVAQQLELLGLYGQRHGPTSHADSDRAGRGRIHELRRVRGQDELLRRLMRQTP